MSSVSAPARRGSVVGRIARGMSDKEKEATQKVFKSALEYVADRLAKGEEGGGADYPLNRGDIVLLVMLIEQELGRAPSDWTDPLNAKRLEAIRQKLGNMAGDAPQMSKAEAQQFRTDDFLAHLTQLIEDARKKYGGPKDPNRGA